MADLLEIRDRWEQASGDAMFNILTHSGKQNGGWDTDEFFAHGADEIASVMAYLKGLGLPKQRRRALDFGCGVGRLTLALTGYFDTVDGVDISAGMVEQARDLCANGACRFVVNEEPDLRLRYRYDLVYSVITLQHMPQNLQHGYVSEFVRLLRSGGVAVFQIPEGPSDLHHPQPWLSMYPTSRETVQDWLADTAGRLVDIQPSEHGGGDWAGYRYVVTKP